MICLEHLQPHIDTFVQVVLGLFFSVLTAVAVSLRTRFLAWLEARTTAQQREILHRLAQEGMALAENLFRGAGGPEKFNEAFEYVQNRAEIYGIKFTYRDLTAAIEKAVLDYNAKVKGGDAR